MRILSPSILLILVLMACIPSITAASQPPIAPAPAITVVQTASDHVVIDVSAPSYTIAASDRFQQIIMPGATTSVEAGKPELPMLRASFGVPARSAVQVLVTPESPTVLPGTYTIAPVTTPVLLHTDLQPGQSERIIDPAVYTAISPYPSALARIADDSWLRSQRIVTLEISPFQYIAARGQLLLHQRLRIELRWRAPSATPVSLTPLEPFESTLQNTLLNYETARAWRQLPQRSGMEADQSSSQVRYKIGVDHEGIYRLSYADLRDAGLNVDSIDPRQLAMTTRNLPVAIEVIGEDDGRFDPGDSVVFYGQPFTKKAESDTIIRDGVLFTGTTSMSPLYSNADTYTNQNAYWLEVGSPGPRMSAIDGAAGTQQMSAPAYRETLHAEQSNLWWTWHFTGRDTWLWDRLQTSSVLTRTYAVALSSVARDSGVAQIRGELVARSHSTSITPDHHTRVAINGVTIDDARWDGPARYQFSAQIGADRLREGSNSIQLGVAAVPGAGSDDLYLDWFEVEYSRRFTATADRLWFNVTASDQQLYDLHGFSTSNITLYDLTQPVSPRRVSGVTVSADGAQYQARFLNNVAGSRFVALAQAAIERPLSISQIQPSSLRLASNQADYLIIAPHDLLASAQRLADYRAVDGLTTKVVDLSELYDTFNDGVYSPIAIKRFLAYAYATWQAPAPAYVVLVGDGTWNFKSYSTARYPSDPILMPPNLAWVDPWQGETDSSNLLAAIVGDDLLPDLAIGRLPVRSAQELNSTIDKIIAYEAAPVQEWQQRMLFLADNVPDQAGDFARTSDELVNDFAVAPFRADKLYLNAVCGAPTTPVSSCPQFNSTLISGLNSDGALLVSYVGHAAIGRWAHEQVFVNADIARLSNGDRLPIMLSMTCLDGYWLYPGQQSLIEDLVRASGRGAIAAFSPTGLGVANGHDVLERGFLSAVVDDHADRLGQATIAGRMALLQAGGHIDLVNTYTLFGDPGLRIPSPRSYVYLPLTTSGQ